MNIDKRLREDAARLAQVKPPKDLRARLQASLDAVPPLIMRAQRPVRKWFMPAVAMLALTMIFVLLPPQTWGVPLQEGATLSHAPQDELSDASTDKNTVVRWLDRTNYEAVEDSLNPPATNDKLERELPLGRIGIFGGLALITGFLCLTELKGRPRLLVPALAALALFVTVGLAYTLGIF